MVALQSFRQATTLKDVAKLLEYKPSAVSYILYKTPPAQKYTTFEIPKKSGGVRQIMAPVGSLKLLQKRLANLLYACRSEIEKNKPQRKSLSHGFRRGHSIVTNARPHKCRRYVLNLDIRDFFPSINFGRVRGFFLKDHDFELNEDVATIVAQVACHDNQLPQGSPCSPVISDLLCHILDVRLAQFAKAHKCTYTRYADDLTFSTNQKIFPTALAFRNDFPGSPWELSEPLVNKIQGAGFAINSDKVRMQCKTSRQVVTGLIVNKKVNVNAQYYRMARAMCNTLFATGKFYRNNSDEKQSDGNTATQLPHSTLAQLEGIVNHIYYVRNSEDRRKPVDKKKFPSATRVLYKQLLFYKYFVALKKPLIICEGKTDSIYLKCAIRKLSASYPKLGVSQEKKFQFNVTFFNHGALANDILQLSGGADEMKFLVRDYRTMLSRYQHTPLLYPVIVLIDNDQGAGQMFSIIKEKFKFEITHSAADKYFHLLSNLYLIKTPELGAEKLSCIENFFDNDVLAVELNGKKFNANKVIDIAHEYGKSVFAEQIILQNFEKISFLKFAPLLDRFVSAIEHYKPPS